MKRWAMYGAVSMLGLVAYVSNAAAQSCCCFIGNTDLSAVLQECNNQTAAQCTDPGETFDNETLCVDVDVDGGGVRDFCAFKDQIPICKDKKLKATGKNTLDLLKAFGKNKKKKNVAKLTTDLSKAQSKMTKGFTRAEWTSQGDPRDCQTYNDVGPMENKVEQLVQDVIDELCPSPSGAFVDGTTGSLH
jgi:hypothetical protein